jgi:hypothetical protein
LQLQGRLALAFLQGRTYIAELPELAAASDPLDPDATKHYRINLAFHDASWYKGKVYLYYGPAPALTFYLPAILLGFRPYDSSAALCFALGSFIFQSLIFLRLTSRGNQQDSFSASGWLLQPLGLLVLALATPTFFILKRPYVYEVAMASSCFFLSGALWFLLEKWFFSGRDRLLILASLFLGFGVGSRITLLFPSIILLFTAMFLLWKEKNSIISFLYLIIPFGLCIFLLLVYNHIRFDSFFEFGISYIMSGFHPKLATNGFPDGQKLSGFFNLIYTYLFNIIMIKDEEPYIYPALKIINNLVTKQEVCWGLLSCFPIKWSIILLPKLSLSWKRFGYFNLFIVNLIFILCGLSILFILCLIPLVSYRYMVNVNLFITLPALIVWFFLMNRLWFQKESIITLKQNIIQYIFIIFAIISIHIGYASNRIGYIRI